MPTRTPRRSPSRRRSAAGPGCVCWAPGPTGTRCQRYPPPCPQTWAGGHGPADADRTGRAPLRDDRAPAAVPPVEVETSTVRTGPSQALLDATRDAAVVVVGAHHRSRRPGPQLGPVAHVLLHRSHCPVVVV
ncbi:universal stress protein [Streptomyces sp. NPDC050564]|uniref:universal stress protein n=1 Tax=Streptomyces sp. NPDC050564 TaxID=3365631 RepID=UPI0037A3A871